MTDDRLHRMREELAAKERTLAGIDAFADKPERLEERPVLVEDIRRLKAAIVEAEGASLTGAGWERP